jgi:FkbM family methyltransferase
VGDVSLHTDTINYFIKHCPKYQQIIAFEPNIYLYEKAVNKYHENKKITFYNSGCYDYDGEIVFTIDNDKLEKSRIVTANSQHPTANTSITISVKAIDNLNLEKVTFIKMDIEGAELKALQGAKQTILKDKPKLAICIYHSDEDMIGIAEFIHEIVPEYKLYVRQYGYYSETVLYAIL